MILSRDDIRSLWSDDPNIAGLDIEEVLHFKAPLAFLPNDYVSHLEAIVEPLLFTHGPCELADTLFRVGRKIGREPFRNRFFSSSSAPVTEWDEALAQEFAFFVARGLNRVSAGGVLAVEQIETEIISEMSQHSRPVPWWSREIATSNTLRVTASVTMNPRLLARFRSGSLRYATSISVRSAWHRSERDVDTIGFFCRGLAVGLMEQWLLETDLHRKALERSERPIANQGQVVRDLFNSIASCCQPSSLDSRASQQVVTAIYFSPAVPRTDGITKT